MNFTHNGWFMFCPVKVADLDTVAPMLAPRHWLLTPVFWLSEKSEQLMITLLSLVSPDYEPSWSIRITGERSDNAHR